MVDYHFETDQFGLSDNGIHLLRSGFNYETINFSSVQAIDIVKGRQVNNWFILLLFGLVLSSFGLFTAVKVIYEYFFADNFHHFYIEQFVIPVLPLFAGPFCIYFSLKTGPVLVVSVTDKTRRFPIGQLKVKERLDELVSFLRKNILTKDKFSTPYQAAEQRNWTTNR